MRKRDIKIGEYYYVVHDVKYLFLKYSSPVSLVEKFKMTRDTMILQPKNIFKTRIFAHMKAIENLNKFRDEQIMIMNKLRIEEDRANWTGIYSHDGVDK